MYFAIKDSTWNGNIAKAHKSNGILSQLKSFYKISRLIKIPIMIMKLLSLIVCTFSDCPIFKRTSLKLCADDALIAQG